MIPNKKSKFKLSLRLFSIVAIILTIFPFIAVDHWTVRVFDFPHLQLTVLTMIAFLIYFFKFNFLNKIDVAFVIVLLSCFIFQVTKIFPYTLFADYEVHEASRSYTSSFSIYTANVLQENENIADVLEDVQKFDADILLFTETDEKWQRNLTKSFGKRHKIEIPLNNTYGMLLYSKLEIIDAKVKYMVEDTIPSIHAKIILTSKDTIQLFAIHPAPPTPQHNPSSVDRDAEMMKIAKLTRESEYPVLVMGDFNDVAWSETTALFQEISGLLDLRKGRGLYNTYNAKSYLMRWPLDHIFSSPEFRLLDVQLGENTNSDHFPFYSRLSFEPKLAFEQKLPEPTKMDIEQAFKQIKKENENP